jgi:hypothetical protein
MRSLSRSAGKGKLKVDVEDASGRVTSVTVNLADSVAVLRREVDRDDKKATLFYNGRAVQNEQKTFASLEVLNGGFFQFRGKRRHHADGESSESDSDTSRHRRSRKAEEMALVLAQLQRQVEQAQAQQAREKELERRLKKAEAELVEARQKNQTAVERIDELESALSRNQALLRRAVEMGRAVFVETGASPVSRGRWHPMDSLSQTK